MATADSGEGAFRGVVDGWFYALEQDVLADSSVHTNGAEKLIERTEELMEVRLASVTKVAPAFSAVLRAYRRALQAEDHALADGLIAWLSGQPNVAARVRQAAGIKGEIDHFGASNFLVGLLVILKDSDFAGLTESRLPVVKRLRDTHLRRSVLTTRTASARSSPPASSASTCTICASRWRKRAWFMLTTLRMHEASNKAKLLRIIRHGDISS